MEKKIIPFELSKADGDGRIIEGHAAVFGNVDLGGDLIHPGAFKKTLAERGNKVKLLWQHDPREPIGKILFLQEDDKGLFVRARISETQKGNDALALMRDKAIEELSFGYDAVKGGTDYTKGDEGDTIRNLREIKLYEVSPVTFPMNEDAQIIAVKAVDVTENTIRVRVRNPGDFDEDSFRTITIGKESEGIQAVIGKLKGEDSTTIQTYIFDKEKWGKDEAVSWVEEHKKSTDYSEIVRQVEGAFNNFYNPPNDPWKYWVRSVLDDKVIISSNDGLFAVAYTIDDSGKIMFAPMGEWLPGKLEFVGDQNVSSPKEGDPPDEIKEGRVLAGRNVERITRALTTLIETLQDAGLDFEMPKREEPKEEEPEDKAGPDGEKSPVHPTSLTEIERKLRLIEIEKLKNIILLER